MAHTPDDRTPPPALPLLAHGKHGDPSRGACFMEYTSVLAGESFTDAPRCVDAELAAVLRSANDVLSDEERTAMVPLLGRAIGLVVPVPELAAGRAGFWLPRRRAGGDDRFLELTATLRRAVARRLMTGIGLDPTHSRWGWYARHTRVSRLFWELMDEPAPVSTSAAYLERLVDRLELLHRCYEDGLAELGLARADRPATSSVTSSSSVSVADPG